MIAYKIMDIIYTKFRSQSECEGIRSWLGCHVGARENYIHVYERGAWIVTASLSTYKDYSFYVHAWYVLKCQYCRILFDMIPLLFFDKHLIPKPRKRTVLPPSHYWNSHCTVFLLTQNSIINLRRRKKHNLEDDMRLRCADFMLLRTI